MVLLEQCIQKMSDPDPFIEEVEAVLEAKSSWRSPLSKWLYEHHDAFAKKLETHRPDWAGLAELFVKKRLMLDPNAEAAKACWHRVKKKVAEERKLAKRRG